LGSFLIFLHPNIIDQVAGGEVAGFGFFRGLGVKGMGLEEEGSEDLVGVRLVAAGQVAAGRLHFVISLLV
jgi:hypothetical protein